MFPPYTNPDEIGATPEYGGGGEALGRWFEDFYPKVKLRAAELGMIECVQAPGETIFVPAGWWHNVRKVRTKHVWRLAPTRHRMHHRDCMAWQPHCLSFRYPCLVPD